MIDKDPLQLAISFRTEVSEAGYQLDARRFADGSGPEPFLIPKSDRRRIVSPFEDNLALYLDLAEADLSDEKAIVNLCNRYGPLDRLEMTIPAEGSGAVVYAEPLSALRSGLTVLADTVRVFNLLRNGQKSELEALIKWGRGIQLRIIESERRQRGYPIARSATSIKKGDVMTAGRWFVVEQVNISMSSRVVPKLFVQEKVFLHEGTGKVFLEPKSLLGGAWLQFALAIENGAINRQCVVCGRWFHPKRSDQHYCGGTCRTRASRSRKDAAK